MSAKNYSLTCSALSNVYISKKSKSKHTISQDRVEVEKSDFIGVLLGWTKGQLEEGENILSITNSKGTVVAEIKLNESILDILKHEKVKAK